MPDTSTFSGIISRETRDAITFKDWFPKSKIQIQEISHMRSTPRQAQVTIPNWLLKSKGIDHAI